MAVPILKVIKNGLMMDNHPLLPPFFSLWDRWPHLKGRSLVIGIIGPRGSGKGNSAARILTLDYLLKGRKVWSDMPIAVDLLLKNGELYPMRSIDKDENFKIKDCYNGVLFADEVNEGDADAYRSQSTESLEFSYDIQELRKSDSGGLSRMDFIWTTQSETFCNPRLRFQTDIIIKCADLSLTKRVGMGEYTRWEIWDYSGIVTGKLSTVKLTPSPIIFAKPWWHAFPTGQRQREKKREEKEQKQNELYSVAAEMASYVRDNEKVRRQILWRKWGITELKQQIALGKILGAEFDITCDYSRQYYRVDKELAEA